MTLLRQLYRNESDINFPRLFIPMTVLSVVLVIVSIVSLFTRGLNLSIDFEGGSVWEVPTEDMTIPQARDVLAGFELDEGSKVQVVTDPDDNRILRVQAGTEDIDTGEKVADAFAKAADVDRNDVGVNTVGPTWGNEITKKARNALIWFLALVALYISWQLEWRMAAAALVSVAHDVLLTVGFYSVFGFDVTPSTVISVLTILGYSLYDTIVVYDRVKENAARYDRSGNYTYTAIMRRSLNQVLMRSVNTSMAALLPVLAMLVIGSGLFNQPTLTEFSLALFVGIVLGAYSSIFVAAPVTVVLKEREERYRRIRTRLRDRGMENNQIPVAHGGGTGARRSAAASDGQAAGKVAATSGSVATLERDGDGDGDGDGDPAPTNSGGTSSARPVGSSDKAARYDRPIPPRPRKQKRR